MKSYFARSFFPQTDIPQEMAGEAVLEFTARAVDFGVRRYGCVCWQKDQRPPADKPESGDPRQP